MGRGAVPLGSYTPRPFRSFRVISRADAFPVLLHTAQSAVENLRTVTSCHKPRLLEKVLRPVRSGGQGVGALPRGPSVRLGAPRAGPAHSWSGRRARRAPLRAAGCALARLGAPRAGGGAWPGRRSLPVIGHLCCNFPESLGEPCRCPWKVCVPGPDPDVEVLCNAPRQFQKTLRLWDSLEVECLKGRRLREGRPGSPPAGKCAAATERQAGVRRRQGGDPLPPDLGFQTKAR